jgi:hypothetical protein
MVDMARFFESAAEAELSDKAGLVDRFYRFIGEGLVRRFEGKWVRLLKQPDSRKKDAPFWPVVQLPFNPEYYGIPGLFDAAVKYRTGDEWASLYGRAEQQYRRWVKAFRPSMDEWMERWS